MKLPFEEEYSYQDDPYESDFEEMVHERESFHKPAWKNCFDMCEQSPYYGDYYDEYLFDYFC